MSKKKRRLNQTLDALSERLGTPVSRKLLRSRSRTGAIKTRVEPIAQAMVVFGARILVAIHAASMPVPTVHINAQTTSWVTTPAKRNCIVGE